MEVIIYIIPVFVALMVAEHYVTARRGLRAYSFHETLGNLYCALGQVFVEIFFKVPLIGLYVLAQRYAFGPVPLVGVAKWLLLFVVVDFLFWLNHLIAHKVPWMWAIHGVHHQAEHFNYSVGLRLPWWHKLTSFWIVVPPALLGFAMTDYVLVAALHGSAQILTHTTLFPKRIPVFEWLFVTPSHHRVHHGRNRSYIDKNFGGILSVWDYLFGTYCPETEPVRYGIPRIKSRVNPWSINVVQFVPHLMPHLPQPRRLNRRVKLAIGGFTVGLMALAGWLFAYGHELGFAPKLAVVAVGLGSMIAVGLWVDHRDDWFRSPARTAAQRNRSQIFSSARGKPLRKSPNSSQRKGARTATFSPVASAWAGKSQFISAVTHSSPASGFSSSHSTVKRDSTVGP